MPTLTSMGDQRITPTMGLNEIIGATRAIEGNAYWIALVVSWMQTLGSQPVMLKISPITGIRGLPKP
jgi:hypothetical protein